MTAPRRSPCINSFGRDSRFRFDTPWGAHAGDTTKDGSCPRNEQARKRWVAHWYLNEPYRDSKGTIRYKQGKYLLGFKTKDDLPTKAAAQNRWEAQRDEVVQDPWISGTQSRRELTFRMFLNDEFIPVRRSSWNKATRAKLSYFFNLMCGDFGDKTIATIERKHLQRFLDRLAERLSHDTVSGCYVYLKAIFAEAHDRRLTTDNPAKSLAPPHTRERDTYTLPIARRSQTAQDQEEPQAHLPAHLTLRRSASLEGPRRGPVSNRMDLSFRT